MWNLRKIKIGDFFQFCFDHHEWTKCATENPQPSGKSWSSQLSPDGYRFSIPHLVHPCRSKQNCQKLPIMIFLKICPIEIQFDTQNLITRNGFKFWNNIANAFAQVVSKFEPIPTKNDLSYNIFSIIVYLDKAVFKKNQNQQFKAILLLSPRVNQMSYRKAANIWKKLRASAFSRWL